MIDPDLIPDASKARLQRNLRRYAEQQQAELLSRSDFLYLLALVTLDRAQSLPPSARAKRQAEAS